MEERITVDRFEGDFALCEEEGGAMRQIPRAELPAGTREGSVLVRVPGEDWRPDLQAEQERRRRIRALEDGLWDS